MLKSAMPVPCRVLVPEVLPAVMPDAPGGAGVPARGAAGPGRCRPGCPPDLPAEGRAALAAALAGPLPGGAAPGPRGNWLRECSALPLG